MPDLRAGLIGYGHAGAVFHAPLVDQAAGLTLSAIVTGNPARRDTARRRYPTAEILDTAEPLLAGRSRVDLVVVAAPNRSHVALARAALHHHIPVVVDKPLAASASDARRLLEESRERGVMLTAFHNRRWDGDFLTAGRLIDSGELGDVFRFESRYDRWRPAPRTTWRESGDPADAGGLLFDLGSHLIDQAVRLFGPVADVYAELNRRRPGVVVDDDVFVALMHTSGTHSHLWASNVAAQRGPRMRILGRRQTFTKWHLDVQEDALKRGDLPGTPGWGEEPPERWGRLGTDEDATRVPTQPGAYQAFYAGVVRSLRDGAPPPVDPADALAGLLIIEAAQRSAATRQVCPIPGA